VNDRRSRGDRAPGEKVAEIQRSRLLAAMVAVADELGYADTTVGDVTGRARISRRTFYEQFANREECLSAVLDEALASVRRALERAELAGRPWHERVRTGLGAILELLDDAPALARVCVVQTVHGGPSLLERREEILAGLAGVVDEGRLDAVRGVSPTPLTAEGVVGAAVAIVQARLARRDPAPLAGLLGELMGMIVLPYRGPAAARRELGRAAPAVPAREPLPAGAEQVAGDPLEGVRMRLTYRTTRVLEGVAEHPGASNRQVAERAGVHDPGQISKLLMRLERIGLLANTGRGYTSGEPNAWWLTPLGERVAAQLRLGARQGRRAA
jgi:AcrR family transcriptional regulator